MRPRGCHSYSRRLRFELLESRRVLSITVDTLVDENNGVGMGAGTSLREAIAAAVSGDTIDFSVTGTIVTTGLLINKNVTISGPGANLLTIQAFDLTPATKTGNGTRAFYITDNNLTNLLDVSISGLTITGGDVYDGGGAIKTTENLVVSDCVITNNASAGSGYTYGGGAILSDPGQFVTVFNSLTLRNCVISGNAATAAEGGAVRKRYGSLLIEDCTISGNSAYYGGGLSAADNNVNVQINRSTFSNNRATLASGYGGGIFARDATVTVTASTISGNTAPAGGGIDVVLGDLTLTDSVVSNNSATGGTTGASAGGGGGILTGTYGLWLTRCTISGNTAVGLTGGGVSTSYLSMVDSTISSNSAGSGGGVYFNGGAGKIIGSTFSGNTASSRGAAIDGRASLTISYSTITANTSPVNFPGAVRIGSLLSSIVAGNTNGDVNGAGTLGYNLVGTGGTFNKPGDQIGVTNPMLGPLADNGGPTKTHVPLPGSPAINTGNPTFNPANPDGNAGTDDALPFDQRGGPFARVYGGRIDKGAVESQPVSATAMGDYSQNGVVDAADYLVWQKMRGTTGLTPYTGAEGSGNGVVDQADYSLWRYHFGSTVPVAGAGSGASGAGLAARVEQLEADSGAGANVEKQPAGVGLTSANASIGDWRPVRVATRSRIQRPAEPGAIGRVHDDALVAWAESARGARGIGRSELAPGGRDSVETTRKDSCDALEVAVGELMSAAF